MVAGASADATRFESAVRHSLDRKVCNTLNVCCVVRSRQADLLPVFERAAHAAAAARGAAPVIHRLEPGDPALATEWEWDDTPEVSVVVVDDVAQAVAECNRHSPHFVASLISEDAAEHERFYRAVAAEPWQADAWRGRTLAEVNRIRYDRRKKIT